MCALGLEWTQARRRQDITGKGKVGHRGCRVDWWVCASGGWDADCGVEYLVENSLSGALVPPGPILREAGV